MSKIGFTFNVKGPESRQVSIQPADFFKSVSKAVVKFATGSYADALSELPDVAASLGFKATPQERVGALVLRALERSLLGLVSEVGKERDEFHSNVHAASFNGLSKEITFQVNRDFFENPNSEELATLLKPDVEKWLSSIGISESDISNIVIRLPAIFVRSLHEEWVSNAAYYSEILEAVESPFTGAAIMEQEWVRYRAHLVSVAEDRVFDESFSLRQIYISPRCYFYEKQNRSDQVRSFTPDGRRRDEPIKVLQWAHAEIEAWIAKQDRDFAIRTIAGGPGSGKSSFAKIIAADLALLGRRVLFVPLHQVDLEMGISRALSNYFTEAGHFSDDPLNSAGTEPAILILDGLDEIQMQGRAAQEAAQGFVGDLIRFIDRKNTASCQILTLITGRDLAVQSAEGSMKLESQVLHLAAYYLGEKAEASFRDDDNIFAIDQRDQWWARYASLTGQSYDAMPDSLRVGELNEVTSQPLLNYLVALSHRRGMKLDETTNINSVYEDLLRAVYTRGWARHSHPSVKDVAYESFVRLLEEVALSVWHGAGRTTTLAEVEAYCNQSKVGALLPSFESGVSSGVSSLLLAFYFRQKGRRDDGSKTFEFTHKTFAEYLIALRVVRLLGLVATQLVMHLSDPDAGIDEQDALHRWLIICGRTPLDSYLLEFIRRELAFRKPDEAASLQKALSRMLENALGSGWPVQRIEKLSFAEQQSYVRNSEETLLACLNACALVSREITLLRWPSETSAGEMIARLQGQRKGPPNRPVMNCLSYMNFDGQYLDIADLYKAKMHHSSFMHAHLNYAMMMGSDLTRAIFETAQMEGVNLSSCNLSEARLPISQLCRMKSGISRGPILEESEVHRSGRPVHGRSPQHLLENISKRGIIVIDETGNQMSDEAILQELRELPEFANARAKPKVRKPPKSAKGV